MSNLCEGLSALGAEVEVFTSDAAGYGDRLDVPIGKPCMVDGVSVTYLWQTGPSKYFWAPALPFLLRRRLHDFDLVHVTAFFTFFQLGSALITLRSGLPLVLSPRGSLMPYAMECRALKKQVYLGLIERPITRNYDAIHCATEMERQSVLKYFPDVPSFVVPNGLGIEGFRHLPTRGALRHRLGLPDDRFVFLYLSRIHPLKGLDLTIRALSEVRKQGCDTALVVAGSPESGSLGPWIEMAREAGVSEHVHCVGHVNGTEKLQCLADADAFVLNSHSENFCMAVVEALACGLPCLISDQVGLADWVSNRGAGIVVPQDERLIAPAMKTMVENRSRFAQQVAAARDEVEKTFDHKVVARHMLEHYEAIVCSRQKH
jgi:glycosyltransferase involved in cell wall biosynthesis